MMMTAVMDHGPMGLAGRPSYWAAGDYSIELTGEHLLIARRPSWGPAGSLFS
jgi:hypothetical protein